MKNYLILGASSAIAKYFINRLKDEGNMVVQLSSGRGINWVYNVDSIKNKIVESKAEIIINFAGIFTNDYSESYKVNASISKNLFDAIIETKFNGKLTLIGSAAEYGVQDNYVESCVEKPQSIYGLTKLMQHSLFQYYVNTFRMKANYIRLFNVVAPNLSERLFIGNFAKQVKLSLKEKTEKIELGDLSSYRDFLLINDVYTGFMKVIEHNNDGEVYNLGMGEAILLKEFVQKILTELGLKVELVTKKINAVGNIKNKVVAQNTKIKNIGWTPKFNYDDLIKGYCKQLRD
ncbi:MAG: NAD(P)-dependent oxidoreductase [Desulfobacteraceae bacterium]|nr:NAD(P)-dependent oxidoreductase [Desulfobacteraceae bacterium]